MIHQVPTGSPMGRSKEGALSVFASDIGLRAGEWPEIIQWKDNGTVFTVHRRTARYNEDELMLVNYQAGGLHLVVFND